MVTFRKLGRFLTLPLALAMFFNLGILPAAQAAMVSSDQVIEYSTAENDRDRVMSFLARDDVKRQMEALGVDPNEAAARVAGLSDGEIAKLAGKLDQLPAGQDSVGAILGVFLVIFLVLLFTDILCLTDVFPFARCAR